MKVCACILSHHQARTSLLLFITVPCTLRPLLLVLPFRTVHDFDKKAGQGFAHWLQMISDPYIESPDYAGFYNLQFIKGHVICLKTS